MNIIGILGVILSLVLLIVLAYKRWNVVVLSVMAAIIVGVTNGFNLFDMLANNYLPGAAVFFQNWFLVFTCGAIYTEFMARSGSAAAIAYKFSDIFGKDKLLFVMCLIPTILTLGGINAYVQIFIIWPMCIVFSKEANISRNIWLAVFYVGLFTGTMIPGSPGMSNIVATNILGVSAASSPLYALFLSLLYFVLGYFSIKIIHRKWETKGIRYEAKESDKAISTASREDCPSFLTSLLPMIFMIVTYIGFTSGWFGFTLSGTNASYISILIATLVCIALNFSRLSDVLKEALLKGSMGGINPVITASVITGYVAVVSNSPAYASFVEMVLNIGGSPYLQVFFATSVVAFITGAGNVAIPTVWGNFGSAWTAVGLNPGTIRPLIVGSSLGVSLCPHSGGLHGVMDFANTNLKESYGPCVIAVVLNGVVTTFIGALVAMIFF